MKNLSLYISLLLLSSTLNLQGQLFSDNCSGGINILPLQDINLCNDSPWILVFEDDFNGDSLDLTKWRNRSDQQGSLITDNEQHYSTLDNVVLEDGVLSIIAKKEHVYALSVAWKDSDAILSDGMRNLRWYDYTTAYIFSHEIFSYGYFEASCKIPFGIGFWPAMWMFGNYVVDENNKIAQEIDVFEFWKNESHNHNMNVHYDGNACLTDYDGPDFSEDFHTYSMRWEPHIIEWYVDGELKRRYPRYYQNGSEVGCSLNAWQPYQEVPFPQNQLTLIFNLAIDNRDGYRPDSTTQFPSSLEIDWVKYYVREDFMDMDSKQAFHTKVYPNPSSGFITIETNENVGVKLINIQYRTILEQNLNDSTTNIDFRFLENGIYFLILRDEKSNQTNYHKIIISK